ncbi:unnamed protein product [Prorocentrum cordatum]|uniref:Uncharacterized protein n=1 Tax=Prorocentrum cordatum TaxID=2364126 RepID=A0ABN9XP63_9DINO|nr:unnamed protein product [Polarella glacialis]
MYCSEMGTRLRTFKAQQSHVVSSLSALRAVTNAFHTRAMRNVFREKSAAEFAPAAATILLRKGSSIPRERSTRAPTPSIGGPFNLKSAADMKPASFGISGEMVVSSKSSTPM